MRIYNNNNFLWKWYINFFLGDTKRPVLKLNTGNDRDTFKLSSQTKTEMRNKEIKEMIDSGEPLKGVSYEEFREYYKQYRSSDVLCDSHKAYKQALKGDKAAIRNKAWRTDPEYSVPVRLYSSPEVTADREAALEKLRRNEELEPWENSILRTFPDAHEGCLLENAAQNEGQRVKIQNMVTDVLSKLGIELAEDDELDFEVWGYNMEITGTLPEDQLDAIKNKLEDLSLGFQLIYQRSGHSDHARSGGLSLVYLQSAEKFLKEAGGGSVFDIGKDEDGNFTGLPEGMSEFIKENAIGKFGFGVDEKYKDREEDIEKALYMRETFNSVIKTVKNGDYDRLKNMTCKLTYKNGVLKSC